MNDAYFSDDFAPPTEADFMSAEKVEKPKIKRKIGCCLGCLVLFLIPVLMILLGIVEFVRSLGVFIPPVL